MKGTHFKHSWLALVCQARRHDTYSYENCRELVPRFMPSIQQTLDCLTSKALPAGSIIVPGCGPGAQELLWVQKYKRMDAKPEAFTRDVPL